MNAIAQTNYCALGKQKNTQRKAIVSNTVTDLENKYDVTFYHLNVNVERTDKNISGNVRTIAKVIVAALDTFAFELHANHTIDSAFVNGSAVSITRVGAAVYAILPQTLNQNQTIDATVYYHGTAPTSGNAAIGDGYNSKASPSWGNRATWSLSESYAAYEWWPCKQQLRDKADSSYCFITTDSTNKAGSNGILTAVVNVGNGKSRYEWKSRHVIDYYLISVSVAQYIDYSFYAHPAGGDSVLIQNYIYNNPATLTNFQTVIDQTDQLVELFSDKFGLYYFNDEKYGHCMAPLSGGMEHQTMTTLGFFEFTIVAHELGHQWFGDNVTCKTWSDIFVNEGFAAYTEYIALEFLNPTQKAQQMLDVHNSVMSAIGGSIWFTDTANSVRIFDSRLTYDKGSALLHMLRYEINNDSIFFYGLKKYQQQYSNSVATAMDFKAVMESVSGQNFTTFFDQWFYGEGYPTFAVKYQQAGSLVRIQNKETVSMPSVTPFIRTHLDYLIHRNIGDTIVRLEQTQSTELYQFNMLGTITSIEVDKNNWVLNKISSIGVDTTLGLASVEETDNMNLIYPNPAQSNFTILSNEKINTVYIYDISGKKVLQYFHAKKLDISMLVDGVYFVETISDFGISAKYKLVKSK